VGREESSESEPAPTDFRDCFFAGEGSGVTKSPGDDRRERTLGDGDARGLAVFGRLAIGFRAARTGISSSSSLLSMVATIGVSCCASCGGSCDVADFLLAANRFFMRSYAASPSLSSSFDSSTSGCASDIVNGFALVEGIGASSSDADADAPLSDSDPLSDESAVVFRRAANSFGRGFTDASVACAGEEGIASKKNCNV
jgi:hypothetical protein